MLGMSPLKRCVFLAALLCLGTEHSSAVAQGIVDFRNGGLTFATDADRLVYADFVGGTKLVGPNHAVGLWYTGGTDLALLADLSAGSQAGLTSHFRPITTIAPGVWVTPRGVSSLFALDGVPGGETAVLQVRVWDENKYADFAQALAAGEYGASSPFLYQPPSPSCSDCPYLMENLRAFALVPEPSAWTFGVLTACLAVWLRRRKAEL
jgi:hypothetical protein